MTPHILLVDDEADIRAIAELALARVGGLDVTTATSGNEALALVRERAFDAVVLDVMMPGMGGVATAEALRKEPAGATLPIVLLTAKSGADADLADAPVNGVLSKPFDPMTLAQELREVLGWAP